LPPGFDYPRKNLPPTFHYTGPLRKPQLITIPFPWERLNGRPLVYASLGTLQNGRDRVFQIFAEACSTLDVQLVLAGISAETARAFAGKPLAVAYAPQIQVLQKAALTLTHAGLNTVLDSLSCAVPMVAVPINYEQPAIAERVRWTGAGEVIPFSALEIGKLRQLISTVLNTASYKQSAVSAAKAVQSAGGVRRAADIIEKEWDKNDNASWANPGGIIGKTKLRKAATAARSGEQPSSNRRVQNPAAVKYRVQALRPGQAG